MTDYEAAVAETLRRWHAWQECMADEHNMLRLLLTPVVNHILQPLLAEL